MTFCTYTSSSSAHTSLDIVAVAERVCSTMRNQQSLFFCHSPSIFCLTSSFFGHTHTAYQSNRLLPRRPQKQQLQTFNIPGRRRIHATGTKMTSPPVDSTRITILKTGKEKKTATHVLYWMSTSLRTSENPSLEQAAFLSNRFKLPLKVIHILDPISNDDEKLPERQAKFQLESLLDVSHALKRRNIPISIYHTSFPNDDVVDMLVQYCDKNNVGCLVVDSDYLKRGRAIRNQLSKKLYSPVYLVEANVIVPVDQVSNKAEYAARTIRPKINRLVPEYLKETPVVQLKYQSELENQDTEYKELDNIEVLTKQDIHSTLSKWKGLDNEAESVSANLFKGGEISSQNCLNEFMKNRIINYAEDRNEPAKQLTSDLSPFLRYGNISPITIVSEVTKLKQDKDYKNKKSFQQSLDSFLEELIVRRELSVNACWYNEDYDVYEKAIPNFAYESLKLHANDKRSFIYSYEELEAGLTHDEYWNAAQIEMVIRGKMFGYMRMYWAKQVIGWCNEPQVAHEYLLKLNNRWELDAIDANSYVGVNWCFGLHDRGWTEREVWGKVRFMNESGLKRKFNMNAYIHLVNGLMRDHGLPAHIEKLRKERGVDNKIGTQLTLKDVASKKKKKVAAANSGRPTKRAKT